ncbi:MAG: polysaccharide deacetylase family protein [Candidatus Omnitrophica bacterium]|nr:polysaccharide deacetylase family protein [Candidatus Omnitrophota bacterium]HOX54234.1 polysaccharide deacetylase family protein [Candidatus Omnitrophota bacterium]
MKKLLATILVIGVLIYAGWFLAVNYLYSVPILMYHHVDGANKSTDSPTVSKENFAKQMELIHKKGYNVISLDALVDATLNKKRLARNSVVITFDDGYKDNYTNAYPDLKKYNFPATIFIITGKIGQIEYVSWEDILEMSKNNISFGSHSRCHRYLPDLEEGEVKKSVVESKKDLEQKLNTEVKYFCYPLGGFSDRIIKIVQEAGYKGACTTNKGGNRFNTDTYSLKRIKMKDADIMSWNLWRKLCGFYYWFTREKAPY